MSKTILAEVDGWTPMIDGMTRHYGLVISAVFGRVWRFCQMPDGVCRASLETISEDLHLNRSTVMDAVHRLVSDGYLEDITPGLRNRPHIFKDTGKAAFRIEINASSGVVLDNTKSKTPKNKPGVVSDNTFVVDDNRGNGHNNVGVVVDPMKKEEERIKERNKESIVFPFSFSSDVQGQVGQPDLMQPVGIVPQSEPPADPVPDPAPGPTAEKAWQILESALINGRSFSTPDRAQFLDNIKPVSLEDGRLVIQVPDEYARMWFISRLQLWALRQLKGICNCDEVSISVITPELEGSRP